MNELGELLESLPVPEHGPRFWDDLAARLGEEAMPLDVASPDPAHPWRRVIVSVAAAAAILIVLILGRQVLVDEDGSTPVITDQTTTTTTQPDTEDAAPVDGAIAGLTWTPGDGVVDNAPITWDGTGWVQQIDDGFGSRIETSTDGRTWESVTAPGGVFRLDGAEKDGEVILAWGAQLQPGNTLEGFAVSTDGGATWVVSPTADQIQDPPPTEFFFVQHPIADADGAVQGDTLLVLTPTIVRFNSDEAANAAGITAEYGFTSEAIWGHDNPADDHVRICELLDTLPGEQDSPPGCRAETQISFAELGVDRGEHMPRLPQRLLRSVGGGPFEEVPIDLGVSSRIDLPSTVPSDPMTDPGRQVTVGVGGGGFYMVSAVAEASTAEVLWSADGQTWETHAFDGSPRTITATDTSLFAIRDSELIRSDDHGETWNVVATPGGEVTRVIAGPSGILLEGAPDDLTGSEVAWSPDGNEFEWVPLRQLVPFDVKPQDTEAVVLGQVAIGQGQILTTVIHASFSTNGEVSDVQALTYLLEID